MDAAVENGEYSSTLENIRQRNDDVLQDQVPQVDLLATRSLQVGG